MGDSSKVRPAEIGIRELRILYDFVSANSTEAPLVLQSDDIVENPVAALQLICTRSGIPYTHAMLDWQGSQSRAEALFSKYAHWREHKPQTGRQHC